MTDYPAAIPLFAIQQLRCPKCRARMKLARTSPGPILLDELTMFARQLDDDRFEAFLSFSR
jgi:hypothetical protein